MRTGIITFLVYALTIAVLLGDRVCCFDGSSIVAPTFRSENEDANNIRLQPNRDASRWVETRSSAGFDIPELKLGAPSTSIISRKSALATAVLQKKRSRKRKLSVIQRGNDSLLAMAPKVVLRDTMTLTALKDWPRPTKQVPPEYPDFARTNGIQANVYMQVLVGKDGRPVIVQVVRITPSYIKLKNVKSQYKPKTGDTDLFFTPSVDAVMQWEFTIPRAPDGEPANVWVNLPLEYKLTQE